MDAVNWIKMGMVLKIDHGEIRAPMVMEVKDLTPSGWIRGTVLNLTEGGSYATRTGLDVAVNLNVAHGFSIHTNVTVR